MSALSATAAFAARAPGYVPPPYLERVRCSLVTLSLLEAPLFAIVVILARSRAGARAGKGILRALGVTAVVILAGACVASLDAANDGFWNPALWGSGFVAACLPAGVAVAIPPGVKSRTGMIVGGIVALLPLFFLIAALGSAFQLWGLQHGLPTTW